jgi:membrane protease YdiL (CAAX protease family)
MKTALHIANSKPLIFTLLILLIWIVLAGLINGIVIFLFKIPIDNLIVLQAGNLVATFILLIIYLRFGWFHELGITKFGVPSTWLFTLAISIYIILVGFFSFFEDIAFVFNSLYTTQEARNILIRSILVGFVEETVFRGALLYSLVRVWGKTRRGIGASIIVQAALFGIFHSLQVLAGETTNVAMANVLETFIFGVLAGAVVLFGETLWPAIVLHAASNTFILIKGLSTPWIDPVFMGYIREALLELPLALLCLWIVLKQKLYSQRNAETDVSA